MKTITKPYTPIYEVKRTDAMFPETIAELIKHLNQLARKEKIKKLKWNQEKIINLNEKTN